jgi:hypothetical protein
MLCNDAEMCRRPSFLPGVPEASFGARQLARVGNSILKSFDERTHMVKNVAYGKDSYFK